MIRTESDPVACSTGEKLRRLGIDGVLYDLDDTLIYTSEIFRGFMDRYVEAVAVETGIPRSVLSEALSRINDDEYKRMGVNPKRWGEVVKRLAESLGDNSGVLENNVDILLGIYRAEPRVRPGVKAILREMKGCGVKQGLVTHANEEWTHWKMDVVGLWDYFSIVLIADENGHKCAEHWRRGMEMLELPPERCLVVGDSLSGDIIPAAGLGARTVWMPSPWSVYRAGVVPEQTVQIEEFNQFLEVLDRLR